MGGDTIGTTEAVSMGLLREGWFVGAAGVGALLVLSAVGVAVGVGWKLLAISWAAFVAMAVGAPLGARATRAQHPFEPVWGHGLASGAMVASTAVYLIPQALDQHSEFGSLGIAAGFLAGYAGHTVGHRFTHLDLPVEHTTAELTVHSVAAGLIIGAIYTAMPSLTALLGVTLVSHKTPAGYAAAQRLAESGRPVITLAVPAAAVGIAALLIGITGLSPPGRLRGLLFGIGAGVFLHVAVDLLPECTTSGKTRPADPELDADSAPETAEHQFRDRLRAHAASSALIGGAVVVAAWLLVA